MIKSDIDDHRIASRGFKKQLRKTCRRVHIPVADALVENVPVENVPVENVSAVRPLMKQSSGEAGPR